MARLKRGDRLDGWTIVRYLGGGGQGEVYEATHDDGRVGALKRLRRASPQARVRLRQEAQAASSLRHPSVVSVLESAAVEADANPYLVYELCRGGSLGKAGDARLVKERFDALRGCEAICEAAAAAHDLRLTHRDIKPENILFGGERLDEPKLGDFGIVHLGGDSGQRVTRTGEVVGPWWYIAPELADGRTDDIGPWNDVYSLGKVIYYVASGGRRPPDRENLRDRAFDLATVTGDPDLEYVAQVLDEAVVADPRKRIRDCRSLGQRLRRAREVILMMKEDREVGRPVEGEWETYRCTFCQRGTYELRVAGWEESGVPYVNSGFHRHRQSAGPVNIAVLICKRCGNIQEFVRTPWVERPK